jgi:hypothetical protein
MAGGSSPKLWYTQNDGITYGYIWYKGITMFDSSNVLTLRESFLGWMAKAGVKLIKKLCSPAKPTFVVYTEAWASCTTQRLPYPIGKASSKTPILSFLARFCGCTM